LSGNCGEEKNGGEGELGQGFHGFVFVGRLWRSAGGVRRPVQVRSLGTAFTRCIEIAGGFLTTFFGGPRNS
jgi:hypothetical protein